MTLEIRERDVLEVVGAEIQVERLATGIGFGEGPRLAQWLPHRAPAAS